MFLPMKGAVLTAGTMGATMCCCGCEQPAAGGADSAVPQLLDLHIHLPRTLTCLTFFPSLSLFFTRQVRLSSKLNLQRP